MKRFTAEFLKVLKTEKQVTSDFLSDIIFIDFCLDRRAFRPTFYLLFMLFVSLCSSVDLSNGESHFDICEAALFYVLRHLY